MTELTEHIRVKANPSEDEDDSAEFMRVFPYFVWAVRDFTLELKIADKPITSDEYLEHALKLKKGEKLTNMYTPICEQTSTFSDAIFKYTILKLKSLQINLFRLL